MAATMSPNPARKRTVKNALLTAGRCARTAIKRFISLCLWLVLLGRSEIVWQVAQGALVGVKRERDARVCGCRCRVGD